MKIGHLIGRVFSPGDTVREKAFSGLVWVYGFQFVEKALKAAQLIIFARLLSPEHIGIVSLSTIAASAVDAMSQAGFKMAVIQSADKDNDTLNTAWSLSFIRGILIYCILFVFAPWIAIFFKTPVLVTVLRVMALSHVLIGMQNIGVVLLSKGLDFKRYSIWESSGIIANFCISIPLVFIWRNEWAIIAGLLLAEVAKTCFSYILHPYRPRLVIKWAVTKRLMDFGIWIAGTKLTEYFSNQLDKIVLAKLFGVTELGIYAMSFRIVALPKNTMGQLASITFPSFSHIKNDNRSISEVFLIYFDSIVLFIFPILGCIFALTPSIVTLILGPKWSPAIEPMRFLLIGATFKVLSLACFPLFNTIGKPKGAFGVTLLSNIVLFVLIYPMCLLWGITGVAIAWSSAAITSFPLCLWSVSRYVHIPLRKFSFILFPFCSSMVLIAGVVTFDHWVSIDSIILMVSAFIIGVFIYVGICLLAHKVFKVPVLSQAFILMEKLLR